MLISSYLRHRLADMMHNLLEVSLDPSVPASLRNIPVKYNIINRLWSIAFYRHLENLRRAAFAVPADAVAFELLQEFICYAYTFYTYLVEERTLEAFSGNWLECLGDLARYRMAVAAMAGAVASSPGAGAGSSGRSLAAISRAAADLASPSPSAVAGAKSPNPSQLPSVSQQKEMGGGEEDDGSMRSLSDKPVGHAREQGPVVMARIDDSPVPSIGLAAARAMEMEPEKERWRSVAREWFAKGVAATPGAGKLHHHLGLLSRDTEGEELRAVYHFVKRCVFFFFFFLRW
jgi:protein SMG6